jgi:chromate transporter
MASPPPDDPGAGPPAPVRPSLFALFLAFGKISLISFGGGVSALMYREFVVNRRWVGEADFLSGLALAQALPGVNVTNLALWLGSQLRGPTGAVVACLGTLIPAMTVILLLGGFLGELAGYPLGAMALAGTAAAALGLTLAMGLRATKFASIDPVSIAILCVTLVGGIMLQSIVLLVLVVAPVSIVLAYRKLGDD